MAICNWLQLFFLRGIVGTFDHLLMRATRNQNAGYEGVVYDPRVQGRQLD
jgi:hypothetical protein